MVGEHFGMAVAELVRAGCITFVSDEGGPVAIVGGEPAQLFGSVEEAVTRIDAVLRSEARQASLHARVMQRRHLFGAEAFADGLREAVEQFIAEESE
jgi:hypothetical protein